MKKITVQNTNNIVLVDHRTFIFADGAIFCSVGVGAYKRGKSTNAKTWRSNREGGLFS